VPSSKPISVKLCKGPKALLNSSVHLIDDDMLDEERPASLYNPCSDSMQVIISKDLTWYI
jgi:hypothetical protein